MQTLITQEVRVKLCLLVFFGVYVCVYVCSLRQALAEALRTNHFVRDINLQRNCIGADGAKAWPALYSLNRLTPFLVGSGLAQLKLGLNVYILCCSSQAFAESLKSLKENIGVRVINMARNPIGADGAKAWPALQSSSKHFTCLGGMFLRIDLIASNCSWP